MNLKCNFDLLKCNKTKQIYAMWVLILSINLSLDLQVSAITTILSAGWFKCFLAHTWNDAFTTDVDEYVKKYFTRSAKMIHFMMQATFGM